MSETQPPAPASPAIAEGAEKRDRAVQVIGEILRLMGVMAKLEAKDAADGGISVAVEMDGDLAGVLPGKRSHVIDAVQFLANKIVNRPGAERRWITIGIGGHPEPRPRPARRPTPAPAAPAGSSAVRSAGGLVLSNGRALLASSARAPVEADEVGLDVSEDAALSDAAKDLASKAAALGRFYAIVGMSRDDRSRVLRATSGISGAKVLAEGDGRNRRVVFVPDKPAPMPKKTLPADDELEE